MPDVLTVLKHFIPDDLPIVLSVGIGCVMMAHKLERRPHFAWRAVELEGAVVESEEFSHTVENGKLVLRCSVRAIENITKRSKIEVR
jgi:hypothetical protein